jgi:hypothetical protein
MHRDGFVSLQKGIFLRLFGHPIAVAISYWDRGEKSGSRAREVHPSITVICQQMIRSLFSLLVIWHLRWTEPTPITLMDQLEFALYQTE